MARCLTDPRPREGPQEQEARMWKVAALAWMPISAVLFGGFIVTVTQMPWLLRDVTAGATALLRITP